MNIPDEAVEAARDAFEADGWSTRGMLDEIIPAAIKAAAPFIVAQELFIMQTQAPGINSAAMDWLSRRRAELDPS